MTIRCSSGPATASAVGRVFSFAGNRVKRGFLRLVFLGFSQLAGGPACAGVPELGDLARTYQGTPLLPSFSVNGSPVVPQAEWRELDPLQTGQVFSHIPSTLSLSYTGLSFSSQQTSALGNYVKLAPGGRVADHAEVVLVTWATAAKHPSWSARDASGYRHPVTAMLYALETSAGGSVSLRLLEQSTAVVHVPWRPLTLPDGRTYPVNGYAFTATIPFSGTVTVPDQCVLIVAYNTQSAGFAPLGVAGPYNELNVGLTRALPKAGEDPDPDVVLWVKNGVWNYPASNWSSSGSPMLRLSTRESALAQPVLGGSGGPVNAGRYHLRLTDPTGEASAETVFEISKAPAAIEALQTKRSVADPDRGVGLRTLPDGLAVAVSYSGSDQVPEVPGKHPFQAVIADRNHQGSLAGELHLTAMRYDQWRGGKHGVSEDGAGDPDGDGMPDRIEYALGRDPLKADRGVSLQHHGEETVEWIFRRRRGMDEVNLVPEISVDLKEWGEAAARVTGAEGEWEDLSVTHQGSRAFLRFRSD